MVPLFFTRVTSLDVIAHEIGHGVCQHTANLAKIITNPEPDALNEGLSDIWGAVIENWAALPNKQTWEIGENIMADGYPCLRSLQNPRTGGDPSTSPTGGYPDTYLGQFWYSANNVVDGNTLDAFAHTNLTVLSHWFYLLSVGGNGWNNGQTSNAPAGSGFQWNVNGIGITEAASIVWEAESDHLIQSSTNYAAIRTNMISAAQNLFGVGSCEEIAVTNAWYAVGVGAVYSGNAGLTISGDASFCTTSKPYTIPNLPIGATVTWQVTPAGIATPGTPNLTQTTLTKSSDGIITLTATISNICGSPIVITKQLIYVGIPAAPTSISALTTIQDIDMLVDGGNIPSNVSSYNWYKNNVMVPNQHTYECDILVNCGVNYLIAVQAVNTCGTSPQFSKLEKAPCGGGYVISPNPASGMVTVSTAAANQLQSKTESTTQKQIYQIKVLGQDGNVLKVFTYSSGVNSTQINLSNLLNGTYILQIYDNVSWSSQQIVILK